ncbi:2-oxo-4-hydroxy-4-carboxy-5-ureidoimidazoline decarboxylase [Thiothrix litoralis]|jgi:2-oxo-4-hydroxy-4-carboxy-5-ureidoimidazoline decarboxylase|uniref:2-oxo-4-hydroxy-4-carboxy-5-ureidoimidazoline decarboxylase n=1 Tax=Thiothrix litoralis TaxID=2891210 RepID=A0ABX7WPG3_9GAMM|nr:2-oxo-4-hydroxy-4-carboxy-5-ureidoimidazoline decarboxylase [Thiothrix litoralis]QTR44911.1 2-oxo-4-hydroxy-4-carboxy-5-ureidoimidazoline decarboxylase [Thiothrix litoralis]
MKIPIATLNQLDQAAFVRLLGGVYEHSPWMAERCYAQQPFAERAALLQAMREVLAAATEAEQLALIRAHPDLAGKAALRGELTAESTQEQAGAGLAQLTPAEFARFTELNTAYTTRFGFPFIMAVKNASKDQILAGFEQRITHTPTAEFAMALEQINRIAAFRIDDLIE